jgi:uncharacterized membrane protein YhaH (DUF805 family)
MAAAAPDQLLTFFLRPQGRISRREFALGAGLIMSLDIALLSTLMHDGVVPPATLFLVALAGLPLTIAMLVIAAKRCHDVGLPGSFVLLLLIPFIGVLWLVVLCILPGKAGPNAYGPPPQFTPE